MLSININISGDKETIAKLGKMGDYLNNWQPELQKAADYLKHVYENQVFETEGAILGTRWPQLSKAYDTWKRNNFRGRGILERTGKLRHGYSTDVNQKSATIGNGVSYGKFHQFGTKFMPKRELVGIDTDRKEKIIEIFKEGLANKLAKAMQNA